MGKCKFTTEEKLKLLVAKDMWSNDDLQGKLVSFMVSDGPVGLRHPIDPTTNEGIVKSIAYPSIQMLAHTWNVQLARKIGNALANDCIENNVDILLAPGVNIKRVPICGRNFEYFSEDPILTGILAKAYIIGLQEKNVGACLKHFCCNNSEYARNWISSEIDERTLREIYLRQFEIACEAEPWTVMSSYNLVNGVRMSEHKKLYRLLREEFGFDGLIMSDWDAVKDRVASLESGLDIEMPYNEKHLKDLYEAWENGELDADAVEKSVQRVVELSEKCRRSREIRKIDMSVSDREKVALDTAREGIVLLKNRNGALPISKGAKIMVTGAPNNKLYFGGGSSAVELRGKYIKTADALKTFAPNVFYSETVFFSRGHSADMGNIKQAVADARRADVAVVCVGNSSACESESFDRQHISLSREEERAILEISSAAKKTVGVVYAGSAVDMSAWIDKVDAVLWAGYGGEFVNVALAEILTGEVNPSGKLAETFPLDLYDVPAINTHIDAATIVYSEGLNVGYRYFTTENRPVLFPFGFGLSYSCFEYSDLRIEGEGYEFTVSVEIENSSDIPGKEIVQLYVSDPDREVYRPIRELKAFEKVFIPAHTKKRIEMKTDFRSFAYYSVARDEWYVHPGVYEIQIGASANDIKLSQTVRIERG